MRHRHLLNQRNPLPASESGPKVSEPARGEYGRKAETWGEYGRKAETPIGRYSENLQGIQVLELERELVSHTILP